MEGISVTLGTLWEQLKTVTIPIIGLSAVDFLLGVFVLKIVIDILRYFLGLQLGSTSEYDTGVKSSYVNGSWQRSRQPNHFKGFNNK